MAPFADKFFLSPEKLEEDLSSIPTFVLNKFKNIYLLGGEPLLHPQVNELMIIAHKYFPNKDIVLLSNGILLPKMNEDFYNNLIKNRIFLSVTQYPINFDYSILKELKKKGVEILTHKIVDWTV
jgi:ABC-2 type transport system ATP-binding protein